MSEFKIVLVDEKGNAKDPHPLGEKMPDKANYMVKDKESGKMVLNTQAFEKDLAEWKGIDSGLKRYVIVEDKFKDGTIFTKIEVLRFHVGDKRMATMVEEPNKIRILTEEWK